MTPLGRTIPETVHETREASRDPHRTLRQIDAKKNIDAGVQMRMATDSYHDPDIASREWSEMFRGHPQLIGLSGDLPESGSYFTVDDFGVPVLAVRGRDGRFRAFLNACRHRGVRVAGEARGKANAFTCPFHSWTYSNQGDLVAIPQEEFSGQGLQQSRRTARRGMARDAVDTSAARGRARRARYSATSPTCSP